MRISFSCREGIKNPLKLAGGFQITVKLVFIRAGLRVGSGITWFGAREHAIRVCGAHYLTIVFSPVLVLDRALVCAACCERSFSVLGVLLSSEVLNWGKYSNVFIE